MQLNTFQSHSQQTRSLPSTWIALSASIMMAMTSIAAPPAPLTKTQLDELDRLAAPMQKKITQEQQAAQKTLIADSRRSETSDRLMRPFIKGIGQGNLLEASPILLQTLQNTPPKLPTDTTKEANPKENQTKVTTIRVECDGGLYFDSENGILAYLKNIRLTEARFTLTCSDELKVFLEKKPAPEKKKDKGDKKTTDSATETTPEKPDTAPPADKETKKKGMKEKAISSFGDLQRIVASGNVKVTQKDDKGKVFTASGNTASYNAKTGEMILKGGLPRLQQSVNQYLQAQEPGQWIKIHKDGKLVTSKGKWVMQTTTKKPS